MTDVIGRMLEGDYSVRMSLDYPYNFRNFTILY